MAGVVGRERCRHRTEGPTLRVIDFGKVRDDLIRPSIGSAADAYDNALMECVIGLNKTECIRTTVFHAGPHRTIGDVEYATARWVDWYNNRRLHGSLGMMTPVEFEQAHYRGPQPRAATRMGAAENLGRFKMS